jgi:hypothetical protein
LNTVFFLHPFFGALESLRPQTASLQPNPPKDCSDVQSGPSDPHIDITVKSHDELERRLVAQPHSEAADIGSLADTVRIERTPRAQSTDREVLRQPWLAE